MIYSRRHCRIAGPWNLYLGTSKRAVPCLVSSTSWAPKEAVHNPISRLTAEHRTAQPQRTAEHAVKLGWWCHAPAISGKRQKRMPYTAITAVRDQQGWKKSEHQPSVRTPDQHCHQLRSRCLLNTATVGDSTTSLGTLFQCLTTLTAKKMHRNHDRVAKHYSPSTSGGTLTSLPRWSL